MSRRPAISRRRFVSLAAAGSAALVAGRALAADAPPAKGKATRPTRTPKEQAAIQKEFDRQRGVLQGALKAIRGFPLPPGGDLPVVFRPLRMPKRGR